MQRYEVWSEGYKATGNFAPANLLGVVEATDFDEAVIKVFNGLYPDPKDRDYWLSKRSNGHWSYWGCRLYDNEKDARKAFG